METANRSAPLDDALNTRLLAALPPRNTIEPRARIVDYEIVEMAVLFRSGELTSVQITVAYLNRISTLNGPFETYDENGGYNAFVRIDANEAMQQAALADAWIASQTDPRGPAPPLCGIPLGVKDTIGIKGRASKNGTQAYSTNFAINDATSVARLRAQGAVLIGHTICSEFSGDVIGQFAGNAWDPDRVPGGSSQGSAVAPIARLVAATLGEETSGSIIIPAAVNGVSAIKPSLGFVSGAGVMPLRAGWDTLGPMARSMRDASLILSIVGGLDRENDPQTLSAPMPLPELPIAARPGTTPLRGLKIGIPQTDWMTTPIRSPLESYGADHLAAFLRFKGELTSLGAQVVDFPGLDLSLAENTPYLTGIPFYSLVGEDGQNLLMINGAIGTTWPAQLETRHWLAIQEFAESLTNTEHRDFLLQRIGPQWSHDTASLIPAGVRVEAESRRRQQQQLYTQALDQEGIDFMMMLPVGGHVDPRFAQHYDRIPVRRSAVEAPNGLAWPVVTFPIGYGNNGVTSSMPVTAAFWGRRFDEALIVQAAIDFQKHFQAYHQAAPPDPDFSIKTRRPDDIPRVRDVPPACSADPTISLGNRSLP